MNKSAKKWTPISMTAEFDFDSGEAIKSPCLGCEMYKKSFPRCVKNCARIGAFQARLVGQVPTWKSVPAGEAYSLAALR